jgi:transposase
LQKCWAVRLHRWMNAYSEDKRKKIVEAVEKGIPTIEAARAFGVGICSTSATWRPTNEGELLALKKRSGSKRKVDEGARKLLEVDLQERPFARSPLVMCEASSDTAATNYQVSNCDRRCVYVG